MNAAFLALIILLFSLLVLGLEYLWLYILVVRQENRTNKYNHAKQKVTGMVESIFYSPTYASRKNDLSALKDFVGEDYKILEMLNEQVKIWKDYGAGDFTENREEIIAEIENTIKPVEFYADMLLSGDKHSKAYACRQLADFGANDYVEEIRNLINSSNRNLSYNAVMALSELGDCESVQEYIENNFDDENYSDRIIFELIRVYGGNRSELAEKLYSSKNDALRANAIKALAPYGLKEFGDLYLKESKSTNTSLKIASVKALAALNDPKYEHDLIIASKDKNWIVRISALHGLEKFTTPTALQSVIESTKDKEWWVRQTAAQALLNMNVSVLELEKIMKGYDRYASDAVKFTLYKKIDIRGDD